MKQRNTFNFVYNQAKLYSISKFILRKQAPVSFCLFVSCDWDWKLLLYQGGNVAMSRLLALAPTGVAAININGIAVALV